jgi:ethanolamine utilization protein EutN
MYLGKVTGNVVSTEKHHSFNNKKILLVKPMQPDGKLKSATMVAVDTVGAGINDVVLVASEGRSATEILGFEKRMPLRSVIVGIVDKINRNMNSENAE